MRRRSPGEALPAAPRPSALVLNAPLPLEAQDESADSRAGEVEVEVVSCGIEALAFTIEPGLVRVHETVGGRDLADFGLVQVAAFPPPTGTLLNAVAAYLRHHGVPAVNADGVGAPTKLLKLLCWAQADLPVPATRYLPSSLLAAAYPSLADQLGTPFVLTALRGGHRPDRLVKGQQDLAARLSTNSSQPMLLAQELIASDVTCEFLILGGDTPVVTQRTGLAATGLSQPPRAAAATLLDARACDQSARQLAIRAAELMGYDVAGVQLARRWSTGQWYVLDANPAPAMSAGAFAADKIRAYGAYLTRKVRMAS